MEPFEEEREGFFSTALFYLLALFNYTWVCNIFLNSFNDLIIFIYLFFQGARRHLVRYTGISITAPPAWP